MKDNVCKSIIYINKVFQMQDFPLRFEEVMKSVTFLYCSHKSKKSFTQLLMLAGNKKISRIIHTWISNSYKTHIWNTKKNFNNSELNSKILLL